MRGFGVAGLVLGLALGAGVVAPGQAGAQVGPRHLYTETADPKAEIAAALKQAKAQHKRVLLDFGADWCGDCQVLDIYFRDPKNLPTLEKNFVVVHIWIGNHGLIDHNLDVGLQYGVPLNKGVPALAVLDANGKILHSQKTGEFNDMRHMDIGSVSEFLNKWKG